MVGAGDIIADRFGRVAAEEDAAGVAHLIEQRLRVIDGELEVFGGEPVDQRAGGLEAVDDDDRAVSVPCGARDRGGGEDGQFLVHRPRDRLRIVGVVGEQDRLRGGVVLGLAQQVGGGPLRIVLGVGDDDDLAGAGDHVDADDAIDLALGLRDPGVAGAGDDVDRRDAACAISERGDRLRAADAPHFIDAGQVRGGEDERVDLAIGGGGDHHQTLDAGDLGGDGVHQQR